MKRHHIVPVCMAAACVPTLAWAEDYQNTDLQVFYTTRAKPDAVNGTGTSDERLTSFRFEHYGTFKYGDNYFFADNYDGKDVGVPGVRDQQYMAYMPRISLGKVIGRDLGFGIIKDVYLGARLEYASYGSFHGTAIGPSFDLKLPGLDWSQLRLFWQGTNYDSRRFYTHFAWGTAVPLLNRKVRFDGYFWTRLKDDGDRQWFAEPDLTLDLDPNGTLQAGMRLTYAKYKGYSRTSPQIITKWNF